MVSVAPKHQHMIDAICKAVKAIIEQEVPGGWLGTDAPVGVAVYIQYKSKHMTTTILGHLNLPFLIEKMAELWIEHEMQQKEVIGSIAS